MANYISDRTGQAHDNDEDRLTSLELFRSMFLDMTYPVGSIYMSVNATSPATLFGGTWEAISGRFLIGTNSTYTPGSTGGEASHTLTVSEMPSHTHSYLEYRGAGSGGTGYVPANSHANSIQIRTDVNGIGDTGGTFTDRPSGYYYSGSFILNTGGSAAHNNMPPYLAVYMWKRTA